MGTEQKANSLGNSTAQNIRLILEQSKKLMGEITKTIDDNPSDQIPEITAALQFTEDTSRLARNMIEVHGGVIFSKDKNEGNVTIEPSTFVTHTETTDETFNADHLGNNNESNRPKTFIELLQRKIDEALPADQVSFSRQDLRNFTESNSRIKKTIKVEEMSVRKTSFSRSEAIRIIQRFLITPTGHLQPKEFYTRSQLLAPRFPVHAIDLDKWSSVVGHDWKQNPTVDYEAAMQIRGLTQLDKILSRRAKPDALQPE